MRSLRLALPLMMVVGCAGNPDGVQVDLAPNLVSSLDAKTTVNALVLAGSTPLSDEDVTITVKYTDRNGTDHSFPDTKAKTDARGAISTPLDGLLWDGTGTVTVTTSNMISGSATFSVLDRTPPKIEILPPTTNNKVGAGLPLDVQVKVSDEIGISEVLFDATGGTQVDRRTFVASGTQMTTLTFRIDVPTNPPNNMVELHALASDLSGNLAAAAAVTLTVDPTITIATPPGLTGSLLTDGTAAQMVNPTAVAMSPKDNQLYVTDDANVTGCTPSCVWKVDPASGMVTSKAETGVGQLSGIAFDSTGDNMYVSDRTNRVRRFAWDTTTLAYKTTSTDCVDPNSQQPQDPFHLIFDGTRILVADDQDRNLQIVASTCNNTLNAAGTALSPQNSFDQPRGVAQGATAADLFVSDNGADRVFKVNATTGARTPFANSNAPFGIEWLAGGTSSFADSLMIASQGDRVVESSNGTGPANAAAYLRNEPIDLAIAAGTMYVLTTPSAGNRGRIYKVTGF